jgi:hypothetical protein
MPVKTPLLKLPAEFDAWEEMAARLPELNATLASRKFLDAMPVLDADAVPNKYMFRAGKNFW